MGIPINGRIAIVEDKFEHAYPLMELFGRMQYPFTYYNGDLTGLPEEGKACNDIRILFLDIYLTGDEIRTEKEIKANILPRLNRIISENNYPYVLIYWSRHEDEHSSLIENIFQNELKIKAPIHYMSLCKSDYFELTGEKTINHEENITYLISRIEKALSLFPVFNYLLEWENIIHISADNVLEEIFKTRENQTEWDNNSKKLFYELGLSFAGKNLKNLEPIEQIRSALYVMNCVFNDSLEHSIANKFLVECEKDTTQNKSGNSEILFSLNKKLLLSDDVSNKYIPGTIYRSISGKHKYGEILNFSINRNYLFAKDQKNICEKLKEIIEENVLKKEKKKIEVDILKKFKEEIQKDWVLVEVNVSPICDFVQDKLIYFRIIPGMLINSKYSEFIHRDSEALYLSPSFKLSSASNDNYFLLLDFRFFTSIGKDEINDSVQPLFRIRQNLLTEIQSKLSHHINRQGLLYLEANERNKIY
ncbi:MAG: hypothetical protein AUJ54_04320 [Ignavibacteria bacterium CG1_02_37_35]|nr:hypothetical protein [Ignavibacteria bacterium]OIO21762.1 MAG: hypothetical protein AUJ54_04320 [Ignavibacteria bacterium CG1_02_37_35]PIX94409.1 MAG: hypothetical protein COZ25_05685 [Ignavibacteria bacterium CG_4_10_14_3_um_filter_37_18]